MGRTGGPTILADGLQQRGFGARILRHAVAHARHPMAGSAMAVTLSSGVGLWVPAEEPLVTVFFVYRWEGMCSF